MRTKIFFIALICCAIFLKVLLFWYAEKYCPQAKFQIDSAIYMESGESLVAHGQFAHHRADGVLEPEIFRTPGYPLFLGILHTLFGISFTGIIALQMVLSLVVGFLTYAIANIINPRLRFLSALIVLFDLPLTVFSLMLLTETLFLFFISAFLLVFLIYLRRPAIPLLCVAALLTAAAAYIRPIHYFFGAAMFIFILYLSIRLRRKRLIGHAFIFLLIVYFFIGVWHMRNYNVAGINTFSTMTQCAASYREQYRDDTAITASLPPALYYLNAVSRCVVSVMTEPGTLKEFDRGGLKFAAKVFGYLWVAFWLIGFLAGIMRLGNDHNLHFLFYVVFFFICASVGGALFGAGYRLRVPMLVCLAIISAHGWRHLAVRSRLVKP